MSKKVKDSIKAKLSSPEMTNARATVRKLDKYRNELTKLNKESVYVVLRSDGAVVGVYVSKKKAVNVMESFQFEDHVWFYYMEKVKLHV